MDIINGIDEDQAVRNGAALLDMLVDSPDWGPLFAGWRGNLRQRADQLSLDTYADNIVGSITRDYALSRVFAGARIGDEYMTLSAVFTSPDFIGEKGARHGFYTVPYDGRQALCRAWRRYIGGE